MLSAAAIATDGTIYFGSSDGSVYAPKPDRTQKWKFSTGGAVRSSLAIGAGGTIYVGSNDNRPCALGAGDLLRDVDRLSRGMSRSQALERSLGIWVRRRAQADLDRAIERYYRARIPADVEEDEMWASLGDEAARGCDD